MLFNCNNYLRFKWCFIMKKRNKNNSIFLFGFVLIFIFMYSGNLYGAKWFQHPDENNNSSIFESISIEQLNVLQDVPAETYFLLFWMFSIAARCVLAATGMVLFMFVSIVEKLGLYIKAKK